MAEFEQGDTSEETFLEDSADDAFGPVQDGPEVSKALMATTTVDSLSDSSSPKWEIAGILWQHDGVKDDQQLTGTSIYIVYAHKEYSGNCWSSALLDGILREFREVSIPNNAWELFDGLFQRWKRLHRVTFGSSSSLERIGASCFEYSIVEEVSIPDSVRDLGDRCFSRCNNIRRVTFSSSSSLERIGVSCFASSVVEEVSIPDTVRDLGDR